MGNCCQNILENEKETEHQYKVFFINFYKLIQTKYQ